MLKNLKELRIRRGLTQSTLGNMLGVSQQAISKYESNIIEPTEDMLKIIAEYFNVSTDYLIGRNSTDEDQESYSYLSKDEVLFMDNVRSLDEYSKVILLSLAQTMKENQSTGQVKSLAMKDVE